MQTNAGKAVRFASIARRNISYKLGDKTPVVEEGVYIAPNAAVIGDVVLKRNSSVWFNATIRGDSDRITIGESTNIQDGSVVHADAGAPTVIGDNVTVGHMAMIHGCTIGDGCLIGIGAVILNRSVIGENCLVGANAFIPEGKAFPPNSLILGSPAKAVKQVSEKQLQGLKWSAIHYAKNGHRFAKELEPVETDHDGKAAK